MVLLLMHMFWGGACKRLNAFPKLGGQDFWLQMLLGLHLLFFCEGKAFDTVVISRWLLAVVRGEPLNERCVPWPSNQKSQMQIQSIYF